MTVRLSIPLRQDDDGGARLSLTFAASRKQTRARNVVLCRRRFDGARPGQLIACQSPVVDLRQGVKILAPGHRLRGMLAKDSPRAGAVPVLADELQAPLKRPHQSIVVPLYVRDLAGAHPSSEQIGLRSLKTCQMLLQIVSESS